MDRKPTDFPSPDGAWELPSSTVFAEVTEKEASEFEAAVRAQFAFLVTDYGFKLAGVFPDQSASEICIAFNATNLSVEAVLDCRDRAFDCLIARLIEGVRPPPGRFYKGKRVRMYISEVPGFSAKPFPLVKSRYFEQRAVAILGNCAKLIRMCERVLADDPAVFE